MEGLRQDVSVLTLLLYISLEKAIRYSDINTRYHIYAKACQIKRHNADEIDIIGRTEIAVKESFVSLQKGAKKMDLKVKADE